MKAARFLPLLLPLLLFACTSQPAPNPEDIPEFTVALSRSSVALVREGRATVTVTLDGEDLDGAAEFRIEGLPSGVSGTFANAAEGTGSVLTLQAAPEAAHGSGEAEVIATLAGVERRAALAITVQEHEIVPLPTTVVLDEADRADLLAYNARDGILRFRAGSGTPAEIEVGDVIASAPSAAAPYGLLRRVTALRPSGSEVVIESEQAALTDAFERVSIAFSRPLTTADLQASTPARPGVRTLHEGGISPQGDGLELDLVDVVLVDLDGDESTTDDQFVVNGRLSLEPILDVDLEIDCCDLLVVPYVDLFRFEVGIEEALELTASGNATFRVREEITLTTLTFTPIVIGPLVFVPRIEVVVGVDGSASASLEVSVRQSLQLRLGAEYRDDGGWRDLNHVTTDFGFDPPSFDLGGRVDLKAYAGLEPEVLLYGVAGVGLELRAKAEFHAQVPGDPVWRLCAGLEAYVNVQVDLPILGEIASHRSELFDLCPELARSDYPPTVRITQPASGASFAQGRERVAFAATARDPEGEPVALVWTLGDGTEIGRGPSFETTSLPIGAQVVRATARDSDGNDAHAEVRVAITNDPPRVEIVSVSPASPFLDERLELTASHYDPNLLGPLPSPERQLTWHLNDPSGSGTPVAYGESPPLEAAALGLGTHTITLFGHDGHARSAPSSVTVTVQETPAGNRRPTAIITAPSAGRTEVWADQRDTSGRYYARVTFCGHGVDPEDGVLEGASGTWYARVAGTSVYHPQGHDTAPGTCPNLRFSIQDGHVTEHEVKLVVRDSEGAMGESAIRTVVVKTLY